MQYQVRGTIPLAYSDLLDPATLPAGTRFLGGAICLDFANTTEQLRSGTPNDWLTSYDVQLVWSQVRGTLSIDAVERLARRARRQRAAASEVFAQACAMRSDIRALAGALVDRRPAAKMLARLNTWLVDLPPQPAINLPGNGRRGHFGLRGDHLDEPLWPVLWSLAALLTSDDATRLGRCEGRGCGYFFVDTTLNRSRRFCSTEGCGNRTRARRHHERHRLDT
jgi:predicted RNA-binding Zn ribbon-like protein